MTPLSRARFDARHGKGDVLFFADADRDRLCLGRARGAGMIGLGIAPDRRLRERGRRRHEILAGRNAEDALLAAVVRQPCAADGLLQSTLTVDESVLVDPHGHAAQRIAVAVGDARDNHGAARKRHVDVLEGRRRRNVDRTAGLAGAPLPVPSVRYPTFDTVSVYRPGSRELTS